MIDANMYVKVEFDEEGRKKIEEAYLTVCEIIDRLRKVGRDTYTMEHDLDQAASYLQAILDGVLW